MNLGNPEDITKVIMDKSFLKSRSIKCSKIENLR